MAELLALVRVNGLLWMQHGEVPPVLCFLCSCNGTHGGEKGEKPDWGMLRSTGQEEQERKNSSGGR